VNGFEPDKIEKLENPPFSILVVCTGNICRSPVAEQLLRARLAEVAASVSVTSAGTYAMVDGAMTAQAAAISQLYGGEPHEHKPQQLARQHIAEADLVLTATREHRSEVVRLHPLAARYTFTIKQYARLIYGYEENGTVDWAPQPGESEPATLRRLIQKFAELRGLIPPPANVATDDIEDPYHQQQKVYDRVGAEINIAATTIGYAITRALGRV
jgi:protein-tyrosine phosphatase